MDYSARKGPSPEAHDHWARLGDFLLTDPHDAGCAATMDMLDVYTEVLAAGYDPAERFPSLHAHLLACHRCAEDLQGLLAALTGAYPGHLEPP